MTLHELLALFTSKNIEYTTAHLDAVDQNAQLTDVASDSREVTPGSLFVCKGTHFSPAYLASAVEAGAVAYLCQQTLAEELQAVAPNVAATRPQALRDIPTRSSPPSALRVQKASLPARICCALFLTATSRTPSAA